MILVQEELSEGCSERLRLTSSHLVNTSHAKCIVQAHQQKVMLFRGVWLRAPCFFTAAERRRCFVPASMGESFVVIVRLLGRLD